MQEPSATDLNRLEASPEMSNILDDLWAEVASDKARENRKAKRAVNPAEAKRVGDKSKQLHELFSDPENWQRTTGVALIHAETETLLGNFSEYVHRSVSGARRLVRESTPIAVTRMERVSGSWWIASHEVPHIARPEQSFREAMLKLHFPTLNAFAPLVAVRAYLDHGAVERVELVEDTQFSDPDGQGLLLLPACTNVLPVMTQADKIHLREEIGL